MIGKSDDASMKYANTYIKFYKDKRKVVCVDKKSETMPQLPLPCASMPFLALSTATSHRVMDDLDKKSILESV